MVQFEDQAEDDDRAPDYFVLQTPSNMYLDLLYIKRCAYRISFRHRNLSSLDLIHSIRFISIPELISSSLATV